MTNIQKLLQRVERLQELLANPQPGLSTWQETFEEALRDVAEYYFTPEVWQQMTGADSSDLVTAVHQLFKDHICGQPVPLPRDIRQALAPHLIKLGT